MSDTVRAPIDDNTPGASPPEIFNPPVLVDSDEELVSHSAFEIEEPPEIINPPVEIETEAVRVTSERATVPEILNPPVVTGLEDFGVEGSSERTPMIPEILNPPVFVGGEEEEPVDQASSSRLVEPPEILNPPVEIP